MVRRSIRLLHVEDDAARQRRVGELVAGVTDFSFTIACADSPEAATEVFLRGGVDCILVDCDLKGGGGLACLQKLRNLDPVVPIIAVSRGYKPDVAAELLRVGADDYLGEETFTGETLAKSLRSTLTRTESQQLHNVLPGGKVSRVILPLRELCQTFVAKVGPDLLRQLDDFELVAKQAKLGPGQMQRLFGTLCAELDAGRPVGSSPVKLLLRPLLLELLVRLTGSCILPSPD